MRQFEGEYELQEPVGLQSRTHANPSGAPTLTMERVYGVVLLALLLCTKSS